MSWLVIVQSTVTVITVVGNLWVLAAYVFHPTIRRVRSNFYIISLAVTDLMVGIIVMPLNIDYHMRGQIWTHPKWMCSLWLIADTLACTASIWTLVTIAIDRLAAVIFPIKYMHLSNLSALYAVALVWILSLVLCLPPIMIPHDPIDFDYCMHTHKPWFLVYSALGAFYVPLVGILAAYGKVYWELRKKMKKKVERLRQGMELVSIGSHGEIEIVRPILSFKNTLQRISNTLSLPATAMKGNISAATSSAHLSHELGNDTLHGMSQASNCSSTRGAKVSMQTASNTALIAKRERKVLVQMAVIVIGFVVCWLPFWILFSTLPICLSTGLCEYTTTIAVLSTSFQWLSYSNSTINPLLYTVFNRDFRNAAEKLIRCCRRGA